MSIPVLSMKQNFLPEHLIMVDCEMTGVQPKKDQLLQVAMLKLERDGTRYNVSGDPLVIYLKHEGQPENDFQKEFLVEIFKKCNESNTTPEQAREQVDTWLGSLRGKATPVGDCVIADLRFLYEAGIIVDSYYEDNESVPGTFHYEIFDMNSLKCCMRTVWGEKKEPDGLNPNIHDALVDCQNQTLELNQLLDELFGVDVTEATSDYSQSMDSYYVSSELPADIAPSVEITDLPENAPEEKLIHLYGSLMLAAQNFEEMQGLINKIMIELGITEEYRTSLAGLINQFRLENEITTL